MSSIGQKTEKSASYYDVLNINPYASDEEIKKAYRKMAMRFHPDQNPQNKRLSELHFKMINEAYSVLKTKDKRNDYNRRMHIHAHNDNVCESRSSWLSNLATFFWSSNNKSQSN